ncbi:MAG: hypothetical protein RMJ81_03830 [Candidatus Kryptonium sp.]|nr:hypothetical protein [Candidatus Kryptonium sp.]MCX7761900.1 hypothetical protein [Candidatus Kryptonium sp.]MDW8108768.1 hypothetical protein [Candidatus Kryptonium sp.]
MKKTINILLIIFVPLLLIAVILLLLNMFSSDEGSEGLFDESEMFI